MEQKQQRPRGSLQARLSANDDRLYNVYRDIGHNFADVMREVAARLEDERWAELREVLVRDDITMDDLGEACQALCLFVTIAVEKPEESMGEVLSRSGWHAILPPAQIAVTAILGTVMMGYYFSGVREATLGGVGPALKAQDLRDRGKECYFLMTMPRWRRRLYLWKRKIIKVWEALGSKDS